MRQGTRDKENIFGDFANHQTGSKAGSSTKKLTVQDTPNFIKAKQAVGS
jgi:hypothetical protein